jgi:hypothetical protein
MPPGCEFPLDFLHELEMQVEEPPQVLDHEQEVPFAVRERCGSAHGVVE